MNATTWILLGELCLVTVALITVGLVYEWRKKKKLLNALELLLINLQEAESERKKTLTERLKNGYQIDEGRAAEMSDEIFRSERQFIQKFIKLLMSLERDSIVHFNDDIYALLAPYWELLPVDRVADSPVPDQAAVESAAGSEADAVSVDANDSEADYDMEITSDSEPESEQPLKTVEQRVEPVVSSQESDIDERQSSGEEISTDTEQAVVTDRSDVESDETEKSEQTSAEPTDESSVDSKIQTDLTEKARNSDVDQAESFEAFVDNIEEEEYIAVDSGRSAENDDDGGGDDPSWDDAFDEAAQQKKVYNLDEIENDDDPIQSVSK